MRSLVRRIVLTSVLGALASAAAAHGGHDHLEQAVGWTWDPWITAPLALVGLLFMRGWRALLGRSGRGAEGLRHRGRLFGLGWLLLAAALVSPLHEAGERSFAAHMTEHELLMLGAAPFLVLSRPLAVLLWAFPPSSRLVLGRLGSSWPVTGAWRALTAPVVATLIQAAALWLWHAPALFDRALASEGWHAAQHLSFLVSALLFWTAMLGRHGGRDPAAGRAVAILCLFATSIVTGALGALMAFSQSPWYAGYARLGMAPFGLTPSEDQQLAGLIMWVPGGLVHVFAALALMRAVLVHGGNRKPVDAG